MRSPAGSASGFTVVLGIFSPFCEESWFLSVFSSETDWINLEGAAY
jgi:hypothetical protein